jgi:8-oxo-dGTP pyrophosphatase MutT (NUDIX family)
MVNPLEKEWQICDRFLELHSRWMTLIGEHLQDHRGEILEYWRIEKADSVIVLPIQGDRILLPSPSYRPGIGQITLDFPGGRVSAGQSSEQAAIVTLKRELGIEVTEITQLLPLSAEGWTVNSSFSNQKLYGFMAQIDHTTTLPPELVKDTYLVTPAGVNHLLKELNCLQCRAVLLEWWLTSR